MCSTDFSDKTLDEIADDEVLKVADTISNKNIPNLKLFLNIFNFKGTHDINYLNDSLCTIESYYHNYNQKEITRPKNSNTNQSISNPITTIEPIIVAGQSPPNGTY